VVRTDSRENNGPVFSRRAARVTAPRRKNIKIRASSISTRVSGHVTDVWCRVGLSNVVQTTRRRLIGKRRTVTVRWSAASCSANARVTITEQSAAPVCRGGRRRRGRLVGRRKVAYYFIDSPCRRRVQKESRRAIYRRHFDYHLRANRIPRDRHGFHVVVRACLIISVRARARSVLSSRYYLFNGRPFYNHRFDCYKYTYAHTHTHDAVLVPRYARKLR